MKNLITLLFFFLASYCLIGQHTFSIVAIDPETGAIGSAGATCLNTDDCAICTAQIISDIVPGKGAINAQATVCLPNSNLVFGIQQVENDSDAAEVLDLLLTNDPCASGNVTNRQYGIVTIDENDNITVKGYTGTNAMADAGHIEGTNYCIQGKYIN